MSDTLSPRSARALGAMFLIVLVGIVVGPLVWFLNRPPEAPAPPAPPAPPEKLESTADRVERLTRKLKRDRSDDRTDAARELGAIGPEASAAVPQLIELLWDRERKVREAATAALDQIDKNWPKHAEARAGVPRLIRLLGENEKTTDILDRIDANWPKLDEAKAVAPKLLDQLLTDMQLRQERDWRDLVKVLDRVDGDWRESPKAKQLFGKLVEQYYRDATRQGGRETDALKSLNKNWETSAELKKARSKALKSFLDNPKTLVDHRRETEESLNQIDRGWRWTEEARAAVNAFIDQLKTVDGEDFAVRIAALDLIDRDWPRLPGAGRIVKPLHARLTATALKDEGDDFRDVGKDSFLLLILAETLDRLDPYWVQSDSAKQAVPKLLWPTACSPNLHGRAVALLDRIEPMWAQSEVTEMTLQRWLTSNDPGQVSLAIAVLDRSEKGEREGEVAVAFQKLMDEAFPHAYHARDRAAIKALGLLHRNSAAVVPKLVETAKKTVEYGGNCEDVIEALGEFGKEAQSAIPVLLELLEISGKKREPDLARLTLRALGRIGARSEIVLPKILSFLLPNYGWPMPSYYFYEAEDVAEAAAEALGGFGKEAAIAVPELTSRVASRQRGYWHAIEALGHIGQAAASAVPVLVENLDKDSVRALGRIGASPELVVPKLVPLLKSKRWQMQQAAAEALGRFAGDATAAKPALLPLLLDENVNTCRAALTALDRIDGKWPESAEQLLPALRKRLDDPNSELRHEAVRAMGRFGAKAADAAPKLVMLLEGDTALRRDATSALVRMNDRWTEKVGISRAVQLLIQVLTARNPSVRKKAAQILGSFGKDSAPATVPLVLLLADWDRGVVESAHAALGRISDGWPGTETARKALPGLMWRLRDPSPHVRANATKALGLFGKDAGAAVTALVLRAADPDRDVRGAARDALGQIDRDWPQSVAAKKAVARLESLGKSKDADVRKASELLLMEINP